MISRFAKGFGTAPKKNRVTEKINVRSILQSVKKTICELKNLSRVSNGLQEKTLDLIKLLFEKMLAVLKIRVLDEILIL